MDMKQLREKVGLKRIDVAYHLQVAESTVRNWESGRTIPTLNFDQTLELCRLYKCSIGDLAEAAKGSRGMNDN